MITTIMNMTNMIIITMNTEIPAVADMITTIMNIMNMNIITITAIPAVADMITTIMNIMNTKLTNIMQRVQRSRCLFWRIWDAPTVLPRWNAASMN